MAESEGGLTRREALKTTAKAAGVAAFATPVVMGVFSTRAAGIPAGCDPSIDSDAIDLLEGNPKRWNLNCETQDSYAGRYNAQRTEAVIPGTTDVAVLSFGLPGTDNFPVECSFYTIDAPAGWVCSATFAVEQANGTPGCSPGYTQFESTPGDCADGFPSNPDFGAPPGAEPLPYCYRAPTSPQDNGCDQGLKLVLTSWVCCPTG